ncbi:Pimeloyl-ACP methyl ester carboxylesterase [Duganella sp. CF517]|uniref:alpha/beta fold hydrolase n=1 Tax=Duganella sp. CF517 TaxID=1881038 RepID=UPI0008B228DD|nr:alpha/beta hydrolase [Duganella sp. CF517]SEN49905.1 Pimeloyl-ACP methyl ester carboxylesterase [Duganella sp. CF517]
MNVTAINTPNLTVDSHGRTLAYRSLGAGHPIVLCARFRGTMDVWDPAFLDALAAQGFQVITFDYSGIGQSSGEKSMHPATLAADANDLIVALGLENVVISGWSLGGMAAQIAIAMYPERISHAVLIGTTPPGPNVKPAEQLFFDTATIPDYTLEHETILFFEPAAPASVAAARRSVERIAQRKEGRSPPVPLAWAAENLGRGPKSPLFPADAVLEALKATAIPILHVGGDHDIIFPVENWYALNGQLPTTQLLTFPAAGHGPHHQHPQAVADYIASFVATTSKTR